MSGHRLLLLHDAQSGERIILAVSAHHSVCVRANGDAVSVEVLDGCSTGASYAVVSDSIEDIAKMLEGTQ